MEYRIPVKYRIIIEGEEAQRVKASSEDSAHTLARANLFERLDVVIGEARELGANIATIVVSGDGQLPEQEMRSSDLAF